MIITPSSVAAKGRKLKVFQTYVGFCDIAVAVPSQAAALRAWGTHQNLFADGQAKLATDDAAVKAALAHPDAPLRRAVGTDDAFALEPSSLPTVPDAPKWPERATLVTKPTAVPTPPLTAPSWVAAEDGLKALDDRRKREEADLRRKQAALDEIAAAHSRYVVSRKAATAAIVDVRKTYRQAGGDD